MDVQLENLTNRPVVLRSNSGSTLRVAPRAVSKEIPRSEIEGNAMADKLQARRILAVREPMKKQAASPNRKKAAGSKKQGRAKKRTAGKTGEAAKEAKKARGKGEQ